MVAFLVTLSETKCYKSRLNLYPQVCQLTLPTGLSRVGPIPEDGGMVQSALYRPKRAYDSR
jgi:hypothetical protein